MILFKKICLSVTLIFITFNSRGQALKINWSAPIEYDRKYSMYSFYGNEDNGFSGFFITTDKKGGKAFILGLTPELKARFQKEIGVPAPEGLSANDKFELHSILYINNKAYAFVSYYNKTQDTRYLFYFTIKNDGTSDNNLTKVSEIDNVGKKEGDFNIVCSEDSSKIAIHSVGKARSKENAAYNIQIFDNGMNKLWGKDVELNYLNKEVQDKFMAVDNDGNVAICGRLGKKQTDQLVQNNYKAFLNVWFGKNR